MLTRVISGAVLILILGAVLVTGYFVPPVVVCFIAGITAIGCFEILHNTKIIKNRIAVVGACFYALLSVLSKFNYLHFSDFYITTEMLTVIFALFTVICSLVLHKQLDIGAIGALIAFPVIISYAFSSIASVYLAENGIFYLLLLLNFSSICDTGAYFTGVLFGKHKLCPEISPKKTIEGAIGGIVFSIIFTVILYFVFDSTENIILMLLLTAIFCIIGMCGDLFASVIKRSVNLKDYGKLIPGHGGILDRFDSILLIAPLFNLAVIGGLV
ncbi:MAG: hypothetical protein E7568_04595 [Ruminococcaceae bacterium]|nr:hypothetical protein [Oscillospiraceae bacterium]